MKILVTGAAGFIGYHLSKKLIEEGHDVVGLDNINDYYCVKLKYSRLNNLGVSSVNANKLHVLTQSALFSNFRFVKMNLEDDIELNHLFDKENFDIVCNLAAQAGVRYSIENPKTYIQSNIVGFANLLECCKLFKIKHLIYASSSSVYGKSKKTPFKTSENVDNPISLYAATKKSNELMAHTYSHLFGIATTGLRFFTVYGPWGRPDMALYIFTDAISKEQSIKVFNYGDMERDFTYVDDIVEGVRRIINSNIDERKETYKIYNIGNNNTVKLSKFIEEIEKNLGVKSKQELLPIQPGDVEKTWANVDDLIMDYQYKPSTSIEEGVKQFVDWFKMYHN